MLHSNAAAERVRWEFDEGGNGHWYEAHTGPELFPGLPRPISWTDADFDARARGGMLATITSEAENEFVFGLIDDPLYWNSRAGRENFGPWLGGVQEPGSPEPGGGWSWVSGEPFVYAHWHRGEPNDFPSNLNEDRLIYFAIRGESGERSSFWNDESEIPRKPVAYVVEYVPEPSLALLCFVILMTWCQCRRRRGIAELFQE
jgi:hypothetical protein